MKISTCYLVISQYAGAFYFWFDLIFGFVPIFSIFVERYKKYAIMIIEIEFCITIVKNDINKLNLRNMLFLLLADEIIYVAKSLNT